jgi:hypothetical protein
MKPRDFPLPLEGFLLNFRFVLVVCQGLLSSVTMRLPVVIAVTIKSVSGLGDGTMTSDVSVSESDSIASAENRDDMLTET